MCGSEDLANRQEEVSYLVIPDEEEEFVGSVEGF